MFSLERAAIRKVEVHASFTVEEEDSGAMIKFRSGGPDLAAVKLYARFLAAFKSAPGDFLVEAPPELAQKNRWEQLPL